MTFEFDTRREEANIERHGVDCATASAVFESKDLAIFQAPKDDDGSPRFAAIGTVQLPASKTANLVVIYKHRHDSIRIISARIMNRKDQEHYAKILAATAANNRSGGNRAR
jgi:uncharacterized DUF497 family protein